MPDHAHQMMRGALLAVGLTLSPWVVALAQAGAECVGDCDRDGVVRISEVIQGVNIGLGGSAVDACPAADVNGDRRVTVNEVVLTVRQGLDGCAVSSVDQLDVADDFDYATARDILVDIIVLTPNGRPFAGVLVMVFGEADDTGASADLIHQGLTDAGGRYRVRLRVPGHLTMLRVLASAIGVANRALVPISGDVATHVFD